MQSKRIRHLRKWLFLLTICCITGISVFSNSSLRAQESDTGPILRNMVRNLKHISAQDAKQFLIDLNIGRSITQLPNTNALIITTDNSTDMQKASSLVSLIDSKQLFAVKTLISSPDPQKTPTNDQFAQKISNLTIGTFRDPPTGINKPLAIIDLHNSNLIAIATKPSLDIIAEAIGRLYTPPVPVSATPAHVSTTSTPTPAPEQKPPTQSSLTLLQQLEKITNTAKSGPTPSISTDNKPAAAGNHFFETELFDSLAQAGTKPAQWQNQQPKPTRPGQAELLEALRALTADKPAPRPEQKTEPKIPQLQIPEPLQEPAQPDQAEIPEALKKLGAGSSKIQTTKPQTPESIIQSVELPARTRKPITPKLIPKTDLIDIPQGEKELETVLALPEDVEIVELIELVGKQLGLNYMYDPTKIKGKITLKIHDAKIKVKDIYSLLESALKFRGFVMVRHGSFVVIVEQKDALSQDPPLRTPGQPIQPGDVIVTSIFKLQHISTDTAEKFLRGSQLGQDFKAIHETGTLMVTGYAFRMPRIEEVLTLIDVPSKPRQFRLRQLKYTIAANLAQKVKALAEQLGTVEITISSTTAAKRPPPAAKRLTAAQKRAADAKAARERAAQAKKPKAPPKKGVYLDTDDRTNRILIIGLQEDIDLVNALIDTLDVEQLDLRSIKLYEIQNIGAEDVENYLFQLDIIGKTSTRRGPGRGTPDRSTSAKTPMRGTQAAQSTSAEEEMPQVIVLETTNALLVNATVQQHERIAMIIAYVDAQLDVTTIPYVVYAIENQDPEKLVSTLEQLIKETTRTTTKEGTSKITAVARREDEDIIRIVFDENTYSLIVYANKKNQQWIGALISELDQYRPQVLLDVTLVEITKQDDFNYDLNILSSIPDFANTSGLTGVISGVITAQSIFDKLNTYNYDRNKFIDMQADSGNFTGFFGDKKINALFTAMKTKKYGRILAKPKLLVDDNQSGSITTSRTTYITRITSSFQATQSGDPIQTSDINFDPYDASITLEIKPHISKGDNLRLEIKLSRSDFVNLDPTSEKPPDRTESNVNTVVTVPDGSTIILGGMEKINQGKGGSKIPLLGDIPILGGLFRSTSNTSTQSKLYIFIKAHILRPGTDMTSTDLIRISKRNRADFEMTESEMQKYENWPGIKSKPMDPEHILEADEDYESLDTLQLLQTEEERAYLNNQRYEDVQTLL